MEICQAEGIPCTRTKYLSESIDDFLERVGGFPIVVKPRSACGSMGFHCIKSREEFDRLLESGDINYTDCVIQEYVNQDGAQYNVHAFMDTNGEISYIVAKKSLQVSYNNIPDGLYVGTQCRMIAKNMIDASNPNALPPYSWIRLVAKTCITEHNLGFDERLVRSEDYHFWVKVHHGINRLYMLGSKAQYHYVQNSGSITHRYIKNYWEGVLIIHHDFLEQLPNDIDTIHTWWHYLSVVKLLQQFVHLFIRNSFL